MSDNVIGIFGNSPEGERGEVNEELVELLKSIVEEAESGRLRAISLTWVSGTNHLNMEGSRSWTVETVNEIGQMVALQQCNIHEMTGVIIASAVQDE